MTKSYEYVCVVGYTEFGERLISYLKNKILSGIYNKSFFLFILIYARSPPPPPPPIFFNCFETFEGFVFVVVFQFFSLRACKEQNGVSLYVVIS